MHTAILSNGSPEMLGAAVSAANIDVLLDAVLSVEELGIFKPDFRVYQLAVDHLGFTRENICFISSNGWDASGAAAFGFWVVWENRYSQSAEHLPGQPEVVLDKLLRLPELLGLGPA